MKKIPSDWGRKYKLHFLVWLLFIAYETMVIGFAFKTFGNPITYLVHYTINIGIFYLNALWLLPWAIEHRKNSVWRVPLIIASLMVIHIGLNYIVDFTLVRLNIITHVKKIELSSKFMLQNVYRCVYFLGFSIGYYLLDRYLKERNMAAKREKEALIKSHKAEAALTKAQNAYLQAQINPHFLFNTLDFVYHSIDHESDKASEAILLLSRMMRYAVKSDETHDFIFLEDEIEQIENLLYLHQLRKSDDLPVELICSSEVRTVKFIPLVLLTLVENIFKHGDLSSETSEATVMVYIDKGSLHIETDNRVGMNKAHSTYTGLTNIRKRLEFAYEKIHFEHGIDERGHFMVNLSIPLICLNVHEKPLSSAINNDIGSFRANVGLPETAG